MNNFDKKTTEEYISIYLPPNLYNWPYLLFEDLRLFFGNKTTVNFKYEFYAYSGINSNNIKLRISKISNQLGGEKHHISYNFKTNKVNTKNSVITPTRFRLYTAYSERRPIDIELTNLSALLILDNLIDVEESNTGLLLNTVNLNVMFNINTWL